MKTETQSHQDFGDSESVPRAQARPGCLAAGSVLGDRFDRAGLRHDAQAEPLGPPPSAGVPTARKREVGWARGGG